MPDTAHQADDTSLYSLAHLTLIGASPPELVYIAARAGYDAVSPRFIPMKVPGEFTEAPVDKAQVQATKTALASTGLKVLDVELARITEDVDPRSFERALELGGELGAKRMIMSAWTRPATTATFWSMSMARHAIWPSPMASRSTLNSRPSRAYAHWTKRWISFVLRTGRTVAFWWIRSICTSAASIWASFCTSRPNCFTSCTSRTACRASRTRVKG